MDDAMLKELRLTLREVFAESTEASVVSKNLAELGWDEARHDDPARTDIVLFEEQGRALAASDVLNTSLCETLGVDRATGVAIPVRGRPANIAVLLADGVPERLVVGGFHAATILPRADVEVQDTGGLDSGLRARRVVVSDSGAGIALPGDVWASTLCSARRSLASELVGVGTEALSLAVTYVSQRTQFGRPIGSFQAVRHRLAEAHVHLAAAQGLVSEAWTSGDSDDARLAKAAAGRAADHAVRSATQVFGAIGLTWEHGLHGYVRRAAVLDALAGDSGYLEEELGRRLVTGAITP